MSASAFRLPEAAIPLPAIPSRSADEARASILNECFSMPREISRMRPKPWIAREMNAVHLPLDYLLGCSTSHGATQLPATRSSTPASSSINLQTDISPAPMP